MYVCSLYIPTLCVNTVLSLSLPSQRSYRHLSGLMICAFEWLVDVCDSVVNYTQQSTADERGVLPQEHLEAVLGPLCPKEMHGACVELMELFEVSYCLEAPNSPKKDAVSPIGVSTMLNFSSSNFDLYSLDNERRLHSKK
jgi:hypothetical protein